MLTPGSGRLFKALSVVTVTVVGVVVVVVVVVSTAVVVVIVSVAVVVVVSVVVVVVVSSWHVRGMSGLIIQSPSRQVSSVLELPSQRNRQNVFPGNVLMKSTCTT